MMESCNEIKCTHIVELYIYFIYTSYYLFLSTYYLYLNLISFFILLMKELEKYGKASSPSGSNKYL